MMIHIVISLRWTQIHKWKWLLHLTHTIAHVFMLFLCAINVNKFSKLLEDSVSFVCLLLFSFFAHQIPVLLFIVWTNFSIEAHEKCDCIDSIYRSIAIRDFVWVLQVNLAHLIRLRLIKISEKSISSHQSSQLLGISNVLHDRCSTFCISKTGEMMNYLCNRYYCFCSSQHNYL